MHTLYILYSESADKYYIGRTNDLDRRLLEHAEGLSWTKRYHPWKVIFTETFETRGEVLRRERYLKSLKNQERLQQYIGGWRSKNL